MSRNIVLARIGDASAVHGWRFISETGGDSASRQKGAGISAAVPRQRRCLAGAAHVSSSALSFDHSGALVGTVSFSSLSGASG